MDEGSPKDHDRKRRSELPDLFGEISTTVAVAAVFAGGAAMMRWVFSMEFGFIAIYLGIAMAIMGAGFWVYSQTRKSRQS